MTYFKRSRKFLKSCATLNISLIQHLFGYKNKKNEAQMKWETFLSTTQETEKHSFREHSIQFIQKIIVATKCRLRIIFFYQRTDGEVSFSPNTKTVPPKSSFLGWFSSFERIFYVLTSSNTCSIYPTLKQNKKTYSI